MGLMAYLGLILLMFAAVVVLFIFVVFAEAIYRHTKCKIIRRRRGGI
jgi:hypothetical protein